MASLDDFLFEPFYQIMRMHLLADRICAEGVSPELPISEAKVIVICPAANSDYRLAVKSTPLGQRFPHLETVEEVVRATLADRDSFAVAAPEEIIEKLRGSDVATHIERWLEYHATRYGW